MTDEDLTQEQLRNASIPRLSPLILASTSYAFRVGVPAMSGSDSIILKSCRIWCSAGGGKLS